MMKMPFYKSTKGRDMPKKNRSITYVMRCFFDIHSHYNWIPRCFQILLRLYELRLALQTVTCQEM